MVTPVIRVDILNSITIPICQLPLLLHDQKMVEKSNMKKKLYDQKQLQVVYADILINMAFCSNLKRHLIIRAKLFKVLKV